MHNVIFKINAGLDEGEGATLLTRIKAMPGIELVAPVRRNATTPAGKRLCFARVSRDVALQEVADALEALPQIDYAEVPPERKLA